MSDDDEDDDLGEGDYDGVEVKRMGYERHKQRARERSAEEVAAGQDIGPIPKCKNRRRRNKAAKNFEYFCTAYFPARFPLAFSDDHKRAISKISNAVLNGCQFAFAMPRGSGKTTLCEVAVIYSVVYGYHKFVAFIGADEGAAKELLDNVRMEFETNERLGEDFPEVCKPIRALDGINNRAKGQTCQGERTRMSWTDKQIILPTVKNSLASGAIIKARGILGRIRGMKHLTADGQNVRPSLVVVDDPQTDESANSLVMCERRETVLGGAILGLAGPGKAISGIVPCTVIRKGDMADRILDRTLHPHWQGERFKMMYAFPTNQKLWDRYAEIQRGELQSDGDGSQANEFYRQNRKEMDAGAKPAWLENYRPEKGEISAIQYAMNLRIKNYQSFCAEYQNEPEEPNKDTLDWLKDADSVAAKMTQVGRYIVREECHALTSFIDVQGSMLFYVTCAWQNGFAGDIIDYGTYPEQRERYFSYTAARATLQRKHPDLASSTEALLTKGLECLTEQILGRQYPREDGAEMRVQKCLIDGNWGDSTDIVYEFCRNSQFASIVQPSHGIGISAKKKPLCDKKQEPGEQLGHHWRIPKLTGRRRIRYVLFDANYWKTFIHRRFAVPTGVAGSMALYKTEPTNHRLIAEHLFAEHPVETYGQMRHLIEWQEKPGRPDNHWFDGVTGCAVAASILGIELPGVGMTKGRGRDKNNGGKRLSLRELQARKLGR